MSRRAVIVQKFKEGFDLEDVIAHCISLDPEKAKSIRTQSLKIWKELNPDDEEEDESVDPREEVKATKAIEVSSTNKTAKQAPTASTSSATKATIEETSETKAPDAIMKETIVATTATKATIAATPATPATNMATQAIQQVLDENMNQASNSKTLFTNSSQLSPFPSFRQLGQDFPVEATWKESCQKMADLSSSLNKLCSREYELQSKLDEVFEEKQVILDQIIELGSYKRQKRGL